MVYREWGSVIPKNGGGKKYLVFIQEGEITGDFYVCHVCFPVRMGCIQFSGVWRIHFGRRRCRSRAMEPKTDWTGM